MSIFILDGYTDFKAFLNLMAYIFWTLVISCEPEWFLSIFMMFLIGYFIKSWTAEFSIVIYFRILFLVLLGEGIDFMLFIYYNRPFAYNFYFVIV
jgi:hypothetical protein